MITTDLKAKLCCNARGCTNKIEGTLNLLASGGFGFKPDIQPQNWMINLDPNGGFAAFCPLHLREVPKLVQPDSKQLKVIQ